MFWESCWFLNVLFGFKHPLQIQESGMFSLLKIVSVTVISLLFCGFCKFSLSLSLSLSLCFLFLHFCELYFILFHFLIYSLPHFFTLANNVLFFLTLSHYPLVALHCYCCILHYTNTLTRCVFRFNEMCVWVRARVCYEQTKGPTNQHFNTRWRYSVVWPKSLHSHLL